MATAGQAMNSARALLNDTGASIWTNTVLLPLLQEAHRELRAKVILNGIPVINEVTGVLNVPAGTTDLSTVSGYPTDMIVPIWLKEREGSTQNADFIDMTQVDFIPNMNQDIWLYWWCWRHEKILLLGSIVDEQVQLRYRRQIPTPAVAGDELGWLQAENYVSYRTASLACMSIGEVEKADLLQKQSDANMDIVIRLNVKQIQGLPAKRRAYHRRYRNGWALGNF